MQRTRALLFLCFAARGNAVNPLGQVLELMDELAAKITKDGEKEAAAYKEYFEWCDDTSKNGGYAIDTAQKEKAKLEATIGELTSEADVASSRIDELAASIATAEKELNDATVIRKKEKSDFDASEAEMIEVIDTLGRAVGILEKEMAKNPASFAQVTTQDMSKAMQAISVVLDAASFSSKDKAKLDAFVQSQANDDSDDLDAGAPAAATYKSHSKNIVDVLEDLKEKAEGQLADLRKGEVNNRHNFDLLKQSLEDQAGADTKSMTAQKGGLAKAEESKAGAEGDLKMTIKQLASSEQQLATARSTCLQVAADHEATVAARKDELSVIAEAKKVLLSSTTGAESQTYSFLQRQQMSTHTDLVGLEVVTALKRLAKRQHSVDLAQLVSRVKAEFRMGSRGASPFNKVKGLIRDMIAKLESQAGAEATEKAYCDEQISKTETKKGELEEDIAKATSRIDKASARSAQLKEEVRMLQGELAALAKGQAEMDRIRSESHADYGEAKSDLELGLNGVRKALDTLRQYYGSGSAAMLQGESQLSALMNQPAVPEVHSKSGGVGGGIIDLLEVVESDFAENLAKEEAEEADAQSEYEKISQENAITKTTKEQDVKYKTQESKSMDATVTEYSGDLDTANTEYAAVMEYYDKIKTRCIAKPETYEARQARRAAEIQGLKEALTILQDETALVQRKKRSFRGALMA